jgi:hypothetical protein
MLYHIGPSEEPNMKTTCTPSLVVAAFVEVLTDASRRGWMTVDINNDWKSVFLFETK